VFFPPAPPAIVWQQPQPQEPRGTTPATTIQCDASGVIHCSVTETVTAPSGADDIRIIARYITLLSERNVRYFTSWRQKLPSAAYEIVRRIHPFPYLPYGDMYAISDMQLTIERSRDRIMVRYSKKPDNKKSEFVESDYVTYETKLSDFMKTVNKELKKLEKK